MTEEQYKKLNECLNECFLRLQKSDPIFIENLEAFSYTSDAITSSFDEAIVCNHQQNKLTFEDVYLLAREIIESINKSYLEKFDNLIRSGVLEFKGDDELGKSEYMYIRSEKQDIINVKRKFNYEDVGFLVHEFMHSTNVGDNITWNAQFLTEFLSIYFEEYSKKYLLEEKQIDVKEIGVNYRIIDFLHANKMFNHYCLILLAYDKLGCITPNTPNEMKQILGINDRVFEKECLNILEQLEKEERMTFSYQNVYDKMICYVNTDYKYIIGTLLAYYALEYCKFEDIVKLNEKINTEEYAYMGIMEVLQTIGIDLNNGFLTKAIACVKKSIQNNKVIK